MVTEVNNTNTGGNAGLQATLADITANGQDTMALQKTLGALNKQIGFTTAIANTQEAMGQAAKGRGEAMKQQV